MSCVIQDNYETVEDGNRCFSIINSTLFNRFPHISKYEFCNPVLQVIVKNENKYLNEWINHHLNLGIKKIIILPKKKKENKLTLVVNLKVIQNTVLLNHRINRNDTWQRNDNSITDHSPTKYFPLFLCNILIFWNFQNTKNNSR